jgi:CheY-like chemotaxis protein/HPt (histidine-containing phosphotransfer) domain-containing protein
VRIRRKCSSGDQAELRIDIADTGCGISADRRPSLFQEFERLGAAASVEGAGLGLAISAHLVTMMGGRLAHEDNEGGGSVFVLTLPLLGALPQPLAGPVCGPLPDREALAAHAAHEPAMTPSAPAAVPAASFRILIIDDVEMNRDIASAFLRAAGHTVTCAESGAQAVKIVAEGAWDVVLMDLRMPEMDGFEATRLIRALGGAKGRVPIVALTAHAFADQIEACSGAGMIGHVAKPFTQAALLSAVTNAVHASRTEVGTSPSGSDQTMRLPVLDLDAFETSASFLTPTKVTTCLAAIIDGAQSLQKSLRDCDVSGQVGAEILDAAHGVAGVAGMFGFVRLSAIARQFERAAQAEATLPPVITQCLHEALEASLLQARRRQRVAEASASESRPRSFHEDGDIQRAAQQKNVSAHPVGTA